MKRFLLVCTIFPLVLSAAITGQWRATATVVSTASPTPQTIGIYATLTQAGGTVAGTAGTNGALKPIQNVAVSGTHVSFTVPEGAGNTTFTLTDLGTKLTGTVTLSTGQILPITLVSVK